MGRLFHRIVLIAVLIVVLCVCGCTSGAKGVASTATSLSPSVTYSESAASSATSSYTSSDESESAVTTESLSSALGVSPVDGKATLVVDGDPVVYAYDDLAHDVEALASNYPAWVHIESLATTVDGRELFHLVIGNPNAANHVLVHAGIHAREYMTTQLVMKQASAFLAHAEAGESYGVTTYADMLESNAIHVVPSVNPDGAALSQVGLDAIHDDYVRQRLAAIAASDGFEPTSVYFRSWKANANGVDLNRNFDAFWNSFGGTSHPSTERYKGLAPGSEIESRALIDLTVRYRFARTISYHAMGSVVYWYFGQDGTLLDETRRFAQAISAATGYRLDANYEYLDPAGYKDWALQSMGIPSLTVEVGSGDVPLAYEQLSVIWRENEHVWETMLE